MSVEDNVLYIADLDATQPKAVDQLSTADDHLRNIKKAVYGSFWAYTKGVVSASPSDVNILTGLQGTGLSYWDLHAAANGLTSGIEAQHSNKAKLYLNGVTPYAFDSLEHDHKKTIYSLSATIVEFAEEHQGHTVHLTDVANNVRIPAYVSVSFTIGCEIAVVRWAAGSFDISPGAGVVLYQNGTEGACHLSPQYAVAVLRQVHTNTWVISGDVFDGAA